MVERPTLHEEKYIKIIRGRDDALAISLGEHQNKGCRAPTARDGKLHMKSPIPMKLPSIDALNKKELSLTKKLAAARAKTSLIEAKLNSNNILKEITANAGKIKDLINGSLALKHKELPEESEARRNGIREQRIANMKAIGFKFTAEGDLIE
jgi:hypothetical protein